MFFSLFSALRKIHIWVGLGILLPLLIVSITAMLLAHDKTLKLDSISLNQQWLPIYYEDTKAKKLEVTAVLSIGTELYIGTKSGMYIEASDTLNEILEFSGMDIRSITAWPGGLLVAAKQGVWASAHGKWHRIYKGDAHGVSVNENETMFIAAHKEGLRISHDGGQTWQESAKVKNALKTLPNKKQHKPLDLKKLIKDLHTGKAIVGKPAEWLWIDILSLLLMISSLLGFYVWWKKRQRGF